jgi:hypothetical protein
MVLNTGAVSSTISENRTHIRNAIYPSTQTDTAAKNIVYTVSKLNADICQIRLAFVDFVIGGPINTRENAVAVANTNNCVNDYLDVATTDAKPIGRICGAMIGQHLYVHLSPTSTDKATLTLNTAVSTSLGPTIAKRKWDIRVDQIPCYASYRAPAGCDRYLMTTVGKITSFNFYLSADTTYAAQTTSAGQNTGIELMSQNINTCIRRAKGMCCTQYQLCTADTRGIILEDAEDTEVDVGVNGVFNSAWSLDTDLTPWIEDGSHSDMGLVDNRCSGDYVAIPSSWAGTCGGSGASASNALFTRYCGSKFGPHWVATNVMPHGGVVCDCSEPFYVRHVTDNANDEGGPDSVAADNTNATVPPRGFCLDFKQTTCYNR